MKPAQPIRLHRHPFSGHSHRVELLLSLLGLPYELVHVDLFAGEQKQAPFLAKNIFGQVPVIEDGEHTLSESTAILLYLAERYDEAGRYWPRTPQGKAQVARWFSVAAGPLVSGPALARQVKLLKRNLDYDAAVATATRLFTLLEGELSQRSFLVGDSASLADVTFYAYVAKAPEGGISLEPYPNLQAWLGRVEALPGFVPMAAAQKP
jgi:glutathione S-transferase